MITDWRKVRWADPDANCQTCRGNPYWGKTLSSWERCECVKRKTPECAALPAGERITAQEQI